MEVEGLIRVLNSYQQVLNALDMPKKTARDLAQCFDTVDEPAIGTDKLLRQSFTAFRQELALAAQEGAVLYSEPEPRDDEKRELLSRTIDAGRALVRHIQTQLCPVDEVAVWEEQCAMLEAEFGAYKRQMEAAFLSERMPKQDYITCLERATREIAVSRQPANKKTKRCTYPNGPRIAANHLRPSLGVLHFVDLLVLLNDLVGLALHMGAQLKS